MESLSSHGLKDVVLPGMPHATTHLHPPTCSSPVLVLAFWLIVLLRRNGSSIQSWLPLTPSYPLLLKQQVFSVMMPLPFSENWENTPKRSLMTLNLSYHKLCQCISVYYRANRTPFCCMCLMVFFSFLTTCMHINNIYIL